MQRLNLSGEYFLLLPFSNLFNNTLAHTVIPEKQGRSGHVTHDGGPMDYNCFGLINRLLVLPRRTSNAVVWGTC